jgi:hypothetical protein
VVTDSAQEPEQPCWQNHDARPLAVKRTLGPLCVSPGLIADRLELSHTVLQHRIGEIGVRLATAIK